MKPIAFGDGIKSVEKLPYSCVHYPNLGGAFLGFQHPGRDSVVLCSCGYDAVINYLEFRSRKREPNTDPRKQYIIGSRNFPIALVEKLIRDGAADDSSVLKYLKFEDRVCHECNLAVPEYRYCHEMYGGVFVQTYGWYIARQAYEFGIHPNWTTILEDRCSDEILDQIEIPPREIPDRREKLLANFKTLTEFDKRVHKQKQRLLRIIENEVRSKFNHKKIGEAWTSETILYHIVARLWPNECVQRHARPRFLSGLELDIYLPNRKAGIEYQGVQHFKPVKHWGGQEALAALKIRDKKKRALCKENGVVLVYFNYNEELSESIVRKKLQRFLDE